MKKRLFLSFLLFIDILSAIQIPISEKKISPPWFTGPLLAPTPLVVPYGHFNLEPYLYALFQSGHYDKKGRFQSTPAFLTSYFEPSFMFGVSSWMDLEINPVLYYKHTSGAGKWEIGDVPVAIGVQLFQKIDPFGHWNCALKLIVQETFPSGRYENLQKAKKRTDIGGLGAWQTMVGLAWGSLFYLGNAHFLTWRTSLQYSFAPPLKVHHLNVYGGKETSMQTIKPANNWMCDIALEANLSKRFALAIDLVGNWWTHPFSAYQFSLAPALEYNWSLSQGVIVGSWFTVAGRNTIQFTSCVAAYNLFY